MADDNDLVSENAQLRRELEGFRRQQAGVVHPAIAQNENAAAQQWNAADQEIKRLEKQHSELLSEGKFEESAALQKTIAAMANRQEYDAPAMGELERTKGGLARGSMVSSERGSIHRRRAAVDPGAS